MIMTGKVNCVWVLVTTGPSVAFAAVMGLVYVLWALCLDTDSSVNRLGTAWKLFLLFSKKAKKLNTTRKSSVLVALDRISQD